MGWKSTTVEESAWDSVECADDVVTVSYDVTMDGKATIEFLDDGTQDYMAVMSSSDLYFNTQVSGGVRLDFYTSDNDAIALAPWGDDGAVLWSNSDTAWGYDLEFRTGWSLSTCDWGSEHTASANSGDAYTQSAWNTMEITWDAAAEIALGKVTKSDGTSESLELNLSELAASGALSFGTAYQYSNTYFANFEYYGESSSDDDDATSTTTVYKMTSGKYCANDYDGADGFLAEYTTVTTADACEDLCTADSKCTVAEMDCGEKCILLESCSSATKSGCDSYFLTQE